MKSFAEALCERVGCKPKEYVWVALKHCLYPRARVFFRLFAGCVRPEDIALLEVVGKTTSEEEVSALLHQYWDDVHLRGGILARRYRFRVSGTRLQKLFRQVMRGETGPLGG